MSQGLRRLAHASMSVGALAWAWGFFARQAPSSPWHLGGFPGAIDTLATHAWITGLAVYVLCPRDNPPRGLTALSTAGTVLSLGAQGLSALRGLSGLQIRDARPESAVVLSARLLGATALCVALALALRRQESSK